MTLLAEIAEKSGENRYACDMVFLLRSTAPLYDKYVERGYTDELFYHTMSDLRVKLFECKEVNGVWGMEPTSWFKKYYMLERFRLGRLQYDKKEFPIHLRTHRRITLFAERLLSTSKTAARWATAQASCSLTKAFKIATSLHPILYLKEPGST